MSYWVAQPRAKQSFAAVVITMISLARRAPYIARESTSLWIRTKHHPEVLRNPHGLAKMRVIQNVPEPIDDLPIGPRLICHHLPDCAQSECESGIATALECRLDRLGMDELAYSPNRYAGNEMMSGWYVFPQNILRRPDGSFNYAIRVHERSNARGTLAFRCARARTGWPRRLSVPRVRPANQAPVPREPARPTLLVGGPGRPARCGATHRRAGIVRLDKTRLRRQSAVMRHMSNHPFAGRRGPGGGSQRFRVVSTGGNPNVTDKSDKPEQITPARLLQILASPPTYFSRAPPISDSRMEL
jgi:hypothetical protein